jgi:L-fuculose-phosphate aldolase
MDTFRAARQQVLSACLFLAQRGLLVGTGGNLSVRIEGAEHFAITPTSTDYLVMTPDDVCIVDFEQRVVDGARAPSVETGMHAAVYRQRLDVNVAVHTHQPWASAFTLVDGGIPALFDEQVLNLGESVELVPYGLSGTAALVANIAARLSNQCNAYLLQNHGVLVVGLSAELALRNVMLLEKCAHTYALALRLGQPVTRLPADSVEAMSSILRAAQRKEVRRKQRQERAGEGPPLGAILSERE